MHSLPDAADPGPELLAPAGDFEAACAAFQYGADAVYLGLPRFSARAEAQNFTPERLDALIAHAHAQTPRRRVYVALNTLIQDAEVPAILASLALLDEVGADAVIVQDLGVARLIRRSFPRLRLHASTQLAVHNLEGARALAALGFARVVLARELSAGEVAGIVRHGGIEVETFVHGALCYSYSGLCLYSSHLAGRSGNRGRCAYCCREPLSEATDAADDTPAPDSRRTFPFSMRDLCLAPVLTAWTRTGIAALKIEGRMKNALYVAALVDFYRRKLDGRLDAATERALTQDIQTIFSRPWTTLYTQGRDAAPDTIIDAAAIGHRGARIGRVQAVFTDREGRRWLHFASERALEKHDGLQIEPVHGGPPAGFGITSLRRAGSERMEVALPAGTDVEVMLPPDELPPLGPGMTVYCSASQSVRRRYPVNTPREGGLRTTRPVDIRVTLSPQGVSVMATAVPACADEAPVSVTHDQPLDLTPARAPQGTAAALQKAFERTGDTRWQVRRLDLIDPQGLYVPPSRLNEIRRAVLESLTQARAAAQASRLAALVSDLAYDQAPAARPPPAQLRWSLKLRLDTGVVPEAADADEIVLALGLASLADIRTRLTAWLAHLPQTRLRLALPLIVRDHEAVALEQTVAALLADGWTRWECASLAGAHLLRRLAGDRPDAIEWTADWSFYALNRVARAQLMELGIMRGVASPEDSRANLQALASFPPPLEALVFQHTPLFIAATAPLTATPARSEWIFDDRRSRRLITRRLDGCTITVAQAPFCLADRTADLASLGFGWVRCDLSWSPGHAAACARAWCETRAGRRPPDSHAGNYLRGLL
jgi:putative protease